ncbi:hypothetical protein [Bacillus cereus]|nr:hypothetical protein [Bacillus cereus]
MLASINLEHMCHLIHQSFSIPIHFLTPDNSILLELEYLGVPFEVLEYS